MKEILWDILMIGIGVVLVIYPGQTMDIVIMVIGILLLVAGLVGVIMGLKSEGAYRAYTMGGAAVSVVGGIICLVQPGLIEHILPIVMGVLILLTGVFNIGNAFSAKKAGASRWVVSLILALITVALGVVILVNLDRTANLLATITGLVFIYNGISTIIMRLLLNRT